MTSIQMYEKKALELFHMYANGDIDIREFLTTLHNFYYNVEEMHKQEIIDAAERWKGTDFAERYYQETFVSKGSDDTFKVWECCGMEECICKGNDDVEKLAEEEYPIFDGDLLGIANNQKHSRIDFIKGYNKAKETLYTEEQVREAIRMSRVTNTTNVIGGGVKLHTYSDNEIIQSLKQPKKD